MNSILKTFGYFYALFCSNIKTHHVDAKRTFLLGFFMFAQNILFFMLWIVFFGSVRQIRGWQLADVANMYGMIAAAIGLSLFLADGVRTLAVRIADGSLDAFLTRPRHPLPALLLSRSNAASLGDMLSGPFFWYCLGHATLEQLPGLLGLSLLSAVIFLGAVLMFYSLAFWVNRSGRFSDQLFETLIIFAAAPQHSQPLGVKFIMFSVLPAGFMSIMPVELLRNFDALKLVCLACGAFVYAILAVKLFNAGVRRYIAMC